MSEKNKQRLKKYQNKLSWSKKMEQNVLVLISIDKVKTKRIVLSKIHSHDNKGLFNYSIGFISESNV